MKFPKDNFLQQIFKHICDIQNIYSFKRTWEIFGIHTIVIPNYEHSFPVHNKLTGNIEGYEDVFVQQVL